MSAAVRPRTRGELIAAQPTSMARSLLGSILRNVLGDAPEDTLITAADVDRVLAAMARWVAVLSGIGDSYRATEVTR